MSLTLLAIQLSVATHLHGTIRDTGGSFDVPIMHLWAFKDQLAVRLEIVLDVPTIQAALQARTQVAE